MVPSMEAGQVVNLWGSWKDTGTLGRSPERVLLGSPRPAPATMSHQRPQPWGCWALVKQPGGGVLLPAPHPLPRLR